MHAATNPFNPGSGLRPPALVGREQELAALEVMVERARNGLDSRGIVLSGLRGVGKTVLLNEMRFRAEAAGWFAVNLEARPDNAGASSVRRILAREITTQARQLMRRRRVSDRVKAALQSVAAFNVKVGSSGIDLGVEIVPGRADSGDIEIDLPELVQDLCAALKEEGSAFGLFIDEVHDLDPLLLRALLMTQHQAGQRGWPFYLIGAGLPHLPGVLADVRSYAERLFDYRTISRLRASDARAALVEPIERQGATIAPDALDLLLEHSEGYPYFLQEYGRAAWEVSPGPVITVDDARTAAIIGLERLDAGFFRSRWDRATPSERRMLVAMAEDGAGPSSSSDVARRMGLKPTSLGPYRANLIAKGLVYAPEHGQVAYTVPGMAGYVHRHREDLD
ncbi:ATP-binding protein [Kineosporiaceae bacterium SCSIO 59966]|nr:ATP-binding protein [Kineosporiaceae bacterium SCSIO 59966]